MGSFNELGIENLSWNLQILNYRTT